MKNPQNILEEANRPSSTDSLMHIKKVPRTRS